MTGLCGASTHIGGVLKVELVCLKVLVGLLERYRCAGGLPARLGFGTQ